MLLKRALFSLLFVCAFAALIGVQMAFAGDALTRFTFAEPHMWTTFRIVMYAPDEATAKAAAKAAFERIEELNGIMSDYDDESELTKLNDKAGGPGVAVSPDLFEILSKSLEYNAKTNGAFDITVGPVVKLWKRAQRRKEMPDPDDLKRAQELVGIQNIVLDAAKKTVELKKKGMRLDLGGIAKGYAVDQALALLKARGIDRALVAGGGDIGVGNPPPNEEGWSIEIQPLDKAQPATGAKLLLKNQGVSTSGDVEQHLDAADGKRYSHIVDPATGKALEGRSSVTVVAQNCTMSDALAKVTVLGVKKGIVTIDSIPGAAVLFVVERKMHFHTPDAPDGSHVWKTDPIEIPMESKAWKDVPKK